MPHPLTLPALSVLAVIGSVGGVFLGRSAIAEINPAYYSDPEPRFHADLSPNPPSMEAPAYRAGALSVVELDQALGTGCVGCRAARREYYPLHDTDEGGYRTGWATVDPAPSVQPAVQVEPSEAELAARAAADAEHAEALARVHRYSTYPLTSGETPAPEEAPSAMAADSSAHSEAVAYAAAELPAAD